MTDRTDRDERTRRSVLRGIGAGTIAGAAARRERVAAVADFDGRPDRRTTGPALGAGSTPDPIPESVTVSAVGDSHEVPVERRIVRGTCDDVQRMGRNSNLLAGGQGAGETNGHWTINGTDAWPLFGTEISSGDRRLETEGTGDDRRIGYGVDGQFEVRQHGEAGDAGTTWRLASHTIDLGANPSIRVLDWHPSHRLSEDCREFWCSAIRQIIDHEKVHARHAFQVAARLNDTLESPDASLDVDGAPIQPLQVGVPADAADPAGVAREKLGAKLRALLYRYLTAAAARIRSRSAEFHGSPAGQGVGWHCDACANCDEHDYRPVTEVREWTLDVDYNYSATVDAGNVSRSVDHFVTASYDLTPTPPLPVIGEAYSFVGDVANTVGSVYNDIFHGGAQDPLPDYGPNPAWNGSGEFAAGHTKRSRIRNDEGEVVRTSLTDATGSGRTEGTSTLEMGRDENRYRVHLGDVGSIQGTSTISDGTGTRTVETTVIAWSGAVAQLQAAGGGIADDVGDVANGNGTPNVDVESLAGSFDLDPPWHPVPDCRKVFVRSFEQDLYAAQGSRLVSRMVLSTDGSGAPVGRERVQWRLAPADHDDGQGPGHVNCP